MKIMEPWIPVKTDENANGVTTEVWGRKYKSGKKSFLESILSQNQEILASPVRFVGEENGSELVLDDFKNYVMNNSDGLYVGMGVKKVEFASKDPKNPAKFYLNSSPAHTTYPTTHIPFEKAIHRNLGDSKNMNKRVINQYIHPDVLKTCQLTMGLTVLEEGNAWNTWPCHTHERRMEVYLYFGIGEEDRVFHMMGEPTETRHIVMRNEQAVISPSWSIHCGFATKSYSFIWGMCGENQTFDDMDACDMKTFK